MKIDIGYIKINVHKKNCSYYMKSKMDLLDNLRCSVPKWQVKVRIE